ncbi:MAG: radical SAM protein [Lachnospiraceae bacterium]|nr:radical SAM protein [Lachnospiraceae bacterium]
MCHVNRLNNEIGFCGETATIRGARAALHFWEEPCISGKNGSGTVFFSGCSLKCIYCQNRSIAIGNTGKPISLARLSDTFLQLQELGACNINLVTATHFVPQIVIALEQAKNHGLSIPVVYNTGTYDCVETIQMLDGLVDIYLPDMKYYSSELSRVYSHAPDYFAIASAAIEEMVHQVGMPVFEPATSSISGSDFLSLSLSEQSEQGLMKKGVIVRHLILPGHTKDSKNILKYLHTTYGNKIFVSIMNQYTPLREMENQTIYPNLSRTLTMREYEKVLEYALSLSMEQVFIQGTETAKESFIPPFDFEGLL